MNLLYPKLRLSWLPAMLGYSLLGALLAGLYGSLHDQVSAGYLGGLLGLVAALLRLRRLRPGKAGDLALGPG